MTPNMLAPYGLRRLLTLFGAADVYGSVGFRHADASQGREQPELAWALSSTESSEPRTILEACDTRLRDMGFVAAGERDETRLYQRKVLDHTDNVKVAVTAATARPGDPPGAKLALSWFFALDELGAHVTVGQLLDVAPYLKHPDVDAALYRFLEPLRVRGVENSVHETQAPYDWTFHKFWVFPPDDLDALFAQLTRVLKSQGFHVDEEARAVGRGEHVDWSEFYFSRRPEEGLGLLLASQSDNALMLALRIYYKDKSSRP